MIHPKTVEMRRSNVLPCKDPKTRQPVEVRRSNVLLFKDPRTGQAFYPSASHFAVSSSSSLPACPGGGKVASGIAEMEHPAGCSVPDGASAAIAEVSQAFSTGPSVQSAAGLQGPSPRDEAYTMGARMEEGLEKWEGVSPRVSGTHPPAALPPQRLPCAAAAAAAAAPPSAVAEAVSAASPPPGPAPALEAWFPFALVSFVFSYFLSEKSRASPPEKIVLGLYTDISLSISRWMAGFTYLSDRLGPCILLERLNRLACVCVGGCCWTSGLKLRR